MKSCKMVRWPLEAEWARSGKAWSLTLRLEAYHSGECISKGASNIHFVLMPKGQVSEYNGWLKWRSKLIMRIVEYIWMLEGEKLDILDKPRELNNYCKCLWKFNSWTFNVSILIQEQEFIKNFSALSAARLFPWLLYWFFVNFPDLPFPWMLEEQDTWELWHFFLTISSFFCMSYNNLSHYGWWHFIMNITYDLEVFFSFCHIQSGSIDVLLSVLVWWVPKGLV